MSVGRASTIQRLNTGFPLTSNRKLDLIGSTLSSLQNFVAILRSTQSIVSQASQVLTQNTMTIS